MSNTRRQQGFTLLELLLVITILVIIAAIGRDFYGNLMRVIGLDADAKTLIAYLGLARSRAMNGEADRNWGLHLVNDSSDYYEIFSSPAGYSDAAKVVSETDYLGNNIVFSDPAEGQSKDIIFTKISATSTATSTAIMLGSDQRTISVSAQGLVE